MGTSLDGRDDRHAYVGYVFQNLNAFVVNSGSKTPGSATLPKEDHSTSVMNSPTCAREDHDLETGSILRNPVEGIDKFRVGLRGRQ